MVAPEVQGIDLFKIANRSISGWVPSFKMGSAAAPVKLPFYSQLEERLILWLEYHPLVVREVIVDSKRAGGQAWGQINWQTGAQEQFWYHRRVGSLAVFTG